MIIEDDCLIFTTGKRVQVTGGVVGLDVDSFITGGFETFLEVEDFTIEEKMELADYMIDVWQSYKEDLLK